MPADKFVRKGALDFVFAFIKLKRFFDKLVYVPFRDNRFIINCVCKEGNNSISGELEWVTSTNTFTDRS